MPNRLATERSPYLLQHAGNPVDWYPWGEDAFARARDEDRPIFLSVGYSTCHWCHVMEHESFENEDVANLLNAGYVSIKVDREERPDLDRVYMAFVQATTGSGGWPMSVWLTPDLKPFYGGTYFPPTSRWGRPGMLDVLTQITQAWQTDRDRLTRSAEMVIDRLRSTQGQTSGAGTVAVEGRSLPGAEVLAEGVEQYGRSFDARHGGFGDAPKFPRPTEVLFLLREHARVGDPGAREMALATLRAMALGGMRDHVGGGFHRYAVDAEWRVPHFEKMLYDQAQLVLAFLEGAQVTGEAFYAAVAEDTLDYVRRDLTNPDGGFLSAEDADSIPPEQATVSGARKSEGAFYIWASDEIEAVLGDDAEIVKLRYGILPDGNAPHDPQGEFTGKNLLYTARSIEDVGRLTSKDPDTVVVTLARARHALFEARERRPRPYLDDKVLTAWSGLMIAASARAGRVLEGWPEDVGPAAGWLDVARRAASFVRAHLWDDGHGRLFRRFRDGDSGIPAYSEDYASLIWGLLELFQAEGDPAWLEWALVLQARQDDDFWDPVDGGWFSTSGEDPSVLLRLKDDHDGAEPSTGSMSAMNLLTIAHLTGESPALEKVEQVIRRSGASLGRLARSVPWMMSVLSSFVDGLEQVVLLGRRDAADTSALRRELARQYRPSMLLIQVEPGEHQARIAGLLPLVGGMTQRGERATAYVCRDFSCQAPVTDVDGLRRALGGG